MNVTATNIRIPRSIHEDACSLNILSIKVLLSITPAHPAYRQAGWVGIKDAYPVRKQETF
jgi:hypothetical protein